MYTLKIYQVFSDRDLHFRGNTSAVVFLKKSLSDEYYQKIASDLNQPATTFLVPTAEVDTFEVRWFAPDGEIDLCGHGAAAAFAFLGDLYPHHNPFTLTYTNGKLTGGPDENDKISMSLEAIPTLNSLVITENLIKGLGIPVLAHFQTTNKNIVVTDSEQSIRDMKPNFELLRQLEHFGYAVTAQGEEVDFVSRTLVPKVQQLEDHATGSSHAMLTPYWAQQLNKQELIAHQLSPRGGKFLCQITKGLVKLTGERQLIASGDLILE